MKKGLVGPQIGSRREVFIFYMAEILLLQSLAALWPIHVSRRVSLHDDAALQVLSRGITPRAFVSEWDGPPDCS